MDIWTSPNEKCKIDIDKVIGYNIEHDPNYPSKGYIVVILSGGSVTIAHGFGYGGRELSETLIRKFSDLQKIEGFCLGKTYYGDLSKIKSEASSNNKESNVISAARAFIERLEYIHQHPQYMGVWQSARIHGVTYENGPKYDVELAALKRALKNVT